MPDGDQFGLRLRRLPPGQHVGVDLLIDDPLLARVAEAEVAGLGPGGQVVDLVVAAAVERVQRVLPREVAASRVEPDTRCPAVSSRPQSAVPRKPLAPVTRISIANASVIAAALCYSITDGFRYRK